MTRVDLSLRQAILLNDVALVQRLLRSNPSYLHNPDYADKSNTSLHLAAQYGLEQIAEFLISRGHDSTRPVEDWIYSNHGDNLGISVNTEGQTPLHLASAFSQAAVVELLCKHFPQTVTRRDHKGQTPLHLASSSQVMPTLNKYVSHTLKPTARTPEDTNTIETLLAHGADVNARDDQGNTCLHNASAWGNLKAVRALIQAGADPLRKNKAGWTPECYSITVQAEVYYRNLVAEWEKRKTEEEMRATERRAKGGGAVRLVPQEAESDEASSDPGRSRASSARSQLTNDSDAGLGISISYVDTWK
ncbi:uncharacterized protein Z518_08117 [Rhinocladiella mackenziei CBS 650.93]|uniref:Ankyrin n=1 Tax=Rhinocladiella mackenziei CBS 650.93 TaxID=1442369 RepID=A0A0D2GV64_9EURO|nr:uncharacterized protein Z518_08117 [Rhinocladiella mackenziei CBS 650.93]KIX02178.1 hypothetical protein Z518_08117 [Rhinocladiella mackenziei CBS 650.93]